MKEFHIINVGTSIITNFIKNCKTIEGISSVKLSDNQFWKNFLNNKAYMHEIYEFVKSNPKVYSAELNSFLRKVEKSQSEEISVYFTGTKTYVNEICVRTLERVIKDYGYHLYTAKEFPGYFLTTYSEENKIKSFIEGISEMLDHLINLATKRKQEGYKVYFNPTGGFKAHVIANALAGFMTFSEVYYIHEEFQDIIIFPQLFYLPKGKEIDVLNQLKDKNIISGKECRDLIDKYLEEIERLKTYGLIDIEDDEYLNPYRIKITEKGSLYLKFRQES